jgi:hypothetical protein
VNWLRTNATTSVGFFAKMGGVRELRVVCAAEEGRDDGWMATWRAAEPSRARELQLETRVACRWQLDDEGYIVACMMPSCNDSLNLSVTKCSTAGSPGSEPEARLTHAPSCRAVSWSSHRRPLAACICIQFHAHGTSKFSMDGFACIFARAGRKVFRGRFGSVFFCSGVRCNHLAKACIDVILN